MSRGRLEISGTIDPIQFWPDGESDGDTVKVVVDQDGFTFTLDPGSEAPRVTHVFDDAIVHGAAKKAAVNKGKITVRLEDADTAEEHYQVPIKGTKNYRQYFGETAATKLRDLIASAGQGQVRCVVRTAIDHPNDAFDTYGRLIGNIIIHKHGKEVNANHWLVQNGWAFPAFYNSALPEEIEEVASYAEEAKKTGKGIWPHLSADVGNPEFNLFFRRKGPADPKADIGPLVFPKLFRRQVLWHVSVMKGLASGTFRDFLATLKDGWVKEQDFLENTSIKPSAKTKNLSTLVDNQGIFELGPAELVFFEKESTLTDAKGKKIDLWWPAAAKAKAAVKAA